MRESRAATIDSLAKSRFDWERVIRELSLVIPKEVWLSNLTGTVAPEVQLDDAPAIGLRTSIPGPALEIVGCARSQPAIASMIAALHDIDGVTRVTAVNGIKTSTTTDTVERRGRQADTTATDTDGTCPPSAPELPGRRSLRRREPVDGADVPTGDRPTARRDAPQATASTERAASRRRAARTPRPTKATNLVPGRLT